MRRLLGLLIGALAALLLVAAPASAHSDLASSNPADGSQVDAVPATITLTFNENLQGTTAKIGVLAGKNDPVQVDAAVSGPTVTVDTTSGPVADLLAKGAEGKWAIGFQVVSADGHPIDGTLTFTVSAAGGSATASGSAADDGAATAAEDAADDAGEDPGSDEPEKVSPLVWLAIVGGAGLAVLAVIKTDRALRKRRATRERSPR